MYRAFGAKGALPEQLVPSQIFGFDDLSGLRTNAFGATQFKTVEFEMSIFYISILYNIQPFNLHGMITKVLSGTLFGAMALFAPWQLNVLFYTWAAAVGLSIRGVVKKSEKFEAREKAREKADARAVVNKYEVQGKWEAREAREARYEARGKARQTFEAREAREAREKFDSSLEALVSEKSKIAASSAVDKPTEPRGILKRGMLFK